MNKTAKGALGAAAAAVLLLGGAGSLAYWTDATTLNGGSITSGSMTLSNPSCDANWKYSTANGVVAAGTNVVKVVPGDTITKTCTFTVNASGDNLKATLTTPAVAYPAPGTGSSLVLNPSAVYSIQGGRALANGGNAITSADNGKVVQAVITVNIPFGTDQTAATKVNANDTQNLTSTLNTINVSLVQNNPA
jgi:alternate signal-mediated exported protein